MPDSNKRPTINLIAAMAENRVIGKDGKLPWHLPDEMKHFIRLTTGHTVVMGRKTFESIGSKPLPNRRNIVLTRDQDYSSAGVEIAHSAQDAIALTTTPPPEITQASPAYSTNPQPPATHHHLFICGGEQAYEDALPMADHLYLTTVHASFEGDAFFPEFDLTVWRLEDEIRHESDDRHKYAFTFQHYARIHEQPE